MGKFSVMSVGRSGVGKSTIGNILLDDDPVAGRFETGSQANSVTHEAVWGESDDCRYCDVPGLPDTNPTRTKQFYDKIIEQAREELSLILFVFKFERIDEGVYKRAKMLFRELLKSRAIKVLVINDMTDYTFGGSKEATAEDYQKKADAITKCIGIQFSYTINMTGSTMQPILTNLKGLLCKTQPIKSPHLKTYSELKQYVDQLIANKNHEQVVYDEAKAEVERLEKELENLKIAGYASAATVDVLGTMGVFFSFGTAPIFAAPATIAEIASAATVAVLGTVGVFFSFGTALVLAAPASIAAGSLTVVGDLKKKELSEAKNKLSKDALDRAMNVLWAACMSFKELKDAME